MRAAVRKHGSFKSLALAHNSISDEASLCFLQGVHHGKWRQSLTV